MCGIFALFNNNHSFTNEQIERAFNLGVNRGPEKSDLINLDDITFGFHRLAINGLDTQSGQPMRINNCLLICNGEIYNYKELFNVVNIKPQTSSDCEIIIHLYKLYGIEDTLKMLDGVFAFILYDIDNSKLFVSRDPFGVRPLYCMSVNHNYNLSDNKTHNIETSIMKKRVTNDNIIGFSSTLNVLSELFNVNGELVYNTKHLSISDSKILQRLYKDVSIKQFTPGTYSSYVLENNQWCLQYNKIYHLPLNFTQMSYTKPNKNIINYYYEQICYYLNQAVKKRVVGTSDRPIACLLSGGLDSSLIAALVNKYYDKQLETYSIGMAGSDDLKNARIVAKHLNSKHNEIVMTEDEFFAAIPDVIKNIESYDTTSVRASVGNYLIGKYIKNNSDAKVIFNGDGSDELTGGYIYFLACPDNIEFDRECKRLLKDIHLFDVLRSDKSISSNGLEPRTPFLDKEWVNYYLSIPVMLRNPLNFKEKDKQIEKYLLRKAFDICEPDLIPKEILWRHKEAFSDGVSGNNGSWYEIINNKVNNMKITYPNDFDYNHILPKTNEQRYYRLLYDTMFPNTSEIVPYLWMPKYVETNDCSARTIDFYVS